MVISQRITTKKKQKKQTKKRTKISLRESLLVERGNTPSLHSSSKTEHKAGGCIIFLCQIEQRMSLLIGQNEGIKHSFLP